MTQQYLVSTDLDDAEEIDAGPQVGMIDVLTWLGEGKRLVLGVTFAAVAAMVTYVALTPDVFTARTTLLPANSQQPPSSAAALAALGSLGGLAGGITPRTPDELYVSLLRSDSVQRKLAAQFDLAKRYDVKSYESLRRELPLYIRVSSEKKSGLITVEVDDTDSKFAASLANAHSTEVSKLLARLAVSEAQQRRVFFEEQLKETKENLIKAEQTLRQTQEKSGMVALDHQSEAIIKAVAELKARILEREVRLKVLRTSTTSQNPETQMAASELSALRSELARMESSSTKGTNGSIDIPVSQLPAAAVEYVRALREVKFQESMLGSMLRQFEIAKLDEAKDSPALQQVDVAHPPDRKSKPARALLVVAAGALSLLLSSAAVVGWRYLRLSRPRGEDDDKARSALAQAWRLRS